MNESQSQCCGGTGVLLHRFGYNSGFNLNSISSIKEVIWSIPLSIVLDLFVSSKDRSHKAREKIDQFTLPALAYKTRPTNAESSSSTNGSLAGDVCFNTVSLNNNCKLSRLFKAGWLFGSRSFKSAGISSCFIAKGSNFSSAVFCCNKRNHILFF